VRVVEEVAARGACLVIRWARDESGQMPGLEFYDSLGEKDQTRLSGLFKLLANKGRITNNQHFKKIVTTNLFEFKSRNVRILGSYSPDGEFLLALGLIKKRDKHMRKDFAKAEAILESHRRRCREEPHEST